MKQALAVKVDVVDGEVCIWSPDCGGGEQRVFVSPEQVDLLIEWLKEKKAQATTKKKASK